jgi:hypothetical protein
MRHIMNISPFKGPLGMNYMHSVYPAICQYVMHRPFICAVLI